jgi:hypothetical protein
VAGEVGKARMPEDCAVGLIAAEPCGGHVIEHNAVRGTLEIFEGHGQAFEQRGRALIGEAVDEELAPVAEQAAQGMHLLGTAAHGQQVRRPVDLHLDPRRGLEAALDAGLWRAAHAGAQLADLIGQDRAAPLVARRADLAQDARGREAMLQGNGVRGEGVGDCTTHRSQGVAHERALLAGVGDSPGAQ